MPGTILKMWQGLGYYQRARNIQRTAEIIVNQYKGQFPDQRALLKPLPGFGPYTIGAVLSIAFNKPEVAIDANIRRVAMRLCAMKGIPAKESEKKVAAFLSQNISKRKGGAFNQGMMELGALICKQRNPKCLSCPLKTLCRAYSKGIQEIIPGTAKKDYKRIEVVVGLIERNSQILIQQRPHKGLLAGLWELPGGKIKKGEHRAQAIKRELAEELGVEVVDSTYLFSVNHSYTFYKVKVSVLKCKLKTLPKTNKQRQWVSLKGMRAYPLPSGTAKIFEKLALKQ